MSSRRCCVKGCFFSKTKLASQTRLYSFPRDVQKCREWLKAIGDPVLAGCTWENLTRNKYVCKQHFHAQHITHTDRTTYNAVPLIFTEPRTPLPESVLQNFDESVPSERNPSILQFSCTDAWQDNDEPCTIVDSAPIDHDYIGSTVLKKRHIPDPPIFQPSCTDAWQDNDDPGTIVDNSILQPSCTDAWQDNDEPGTIVGSKNNQEDFAKQQMLENVRKELCRLCGQKGLLMMPIFKPTSDTSQYMPVSSKIDMYLPIKVRVDDPLPFCICSNCFKVLNQWHDLYVTCVAADAVLWKTFGRETETTIQHQDYADKSEMQQNGAKVDAEVQTEPMLLDSLICDSQVMGKDTHYGNKIGIIQPDDKLFAEEFDKNKYTYGRHFYKCRFCYEFFKNSPDHKKHIAMCRQQSTICELCGHTVSCRKDLKRHKYQKHIKKVDQQRFFCDKCDRSFKSAPRLGHHRETIHNVDRSGKFCCELCCTVFMREVYFRKHKRKHAKGKIKSTFQIEAFRHCKNSLLKSSVTSAAYTCPVCQGVFNDTLSFAEHLTEKKKIKCSLCLKIMSCEKRFYLHVCGHWTCQYCLKSFDKKVKWLVHERLHTGEKPLKCRHCDSTFRTWQSRRQHETRHEPLKKCPYCEKSYRNKYVFQDHVSCHEGKEFVCLLCDKKFSGRKNLGKHVNMFHKANKKTSVVSE